MNFVISCDDYYQYTQIFKDKTDKIKELLNHVVFKELCIVKYIYNNVESYIRVYPTIQFLYSLFINPKYLGSDVKKISNPE